MFTGHMHMQSVNRRRTRQGKFFIDINTGSAVGGPAMVRKCTIDSNRRMTITSMPSAQNFDWDKQGMTAEEYFLWRFKRKVRHETRKLPKFMQHIAACIVPRIFYGRRKDSHCVIDLNCGKISRHSS